MGLQAYVLPGLSCFQLTRGGAVWHITIIPWALVVCLICTPSALGPAALGLCVYIRIRPTTRAHGITITCSYVVDCYN